MRRDSLGIYTIEVLDEPHQIFTLQIWNSVSVFIPTKEVAELPVELWQGSVEIMELF